MSPTGLLTRTAPVSSAEQKDRATWPGDGEKHRGTFTSRRRQMFIASLALAQVAVWHVSSRHFFRCLLLSLLLTFALALDLHRETRFVAVRFPQLRIRPRWLVGTKVAPLVGRVTALHRWLDLTPWAFFNHVQTVLFAFWPLMSPEGHRAVHFERELLQCRDGGQVALDWICLEGEGPPSSDCSEIIVLHLPGIVGVFSNQYLLRFARHTRLRCVVKSWRGIGCRLTSGRPETWDLQAVEDTVEVAKHLRETFPKAKLVVVGWSHGGNVALAALAAGPALFHAGIMVSAPTDLSTVIPWLESSSLMPYAYLNTCRMFQEISKEENRQMIVDTAPSVAEHFPVVQESLRPRHMATHCWVRRPYGSTYHEFITCHYTKHDSAQAYYQSLADMVEQAIPRVAVPTLCLLSEDDPVTPSFSFSKYVQLASPSMVVALTPRGGHGGWFCGFKGLSWVNEVSRDFCREAVLSAQPPRSRG